LGEIGHANGHHLITQRLHSVDAVLVPGAQFSKLSEGAGTFALATQTPIPSLSPELDSVGQLPY